MPSTASNPNAVSAARARTASTRRAANAAAAKAAPGLDEQLCFALYATSLAMTKVYRPLLAPLGLTYPQYIVMLALWQHGELSAGGLGERVALDSGTLAPLLRKLVALGLITRQRSAVDDRSVLIALTEGGRQLQRRSQAVHERVACATQCTDAQRAALTASLQRLRKALRAELTNTATATPPPGRAR